MVAKRTPYDLAGLPYEMYMGDPRPICTENIHSGKGPSMTRQLLRHFFIDTEKLHIT